jgi:hypothetical protein
MTGTSRDDVFAASSMTSNSTASAIRESFHYLPQINEALPHERAEYRESLATVIKDAHEQHVTDFLR